jgi:hypothetical protein
MSTPAKTFSPEKIRVTYPTGLVITMDVTAWDTLELADWITYAITNGIVVEEV